MIRDMVEIMFRGAFVKNADDEDLFKIEDFLFRIGVIQGCKVDRSERVKAFRMMRKAYSGHKVNTLEGKFVTQALAMIVLANYNGEECAQMLYEMGQILLLCIDGENAPSLEQCREMVENVRY